MSEPTEAQIKKFWKWCGWYQTDEIEGKAWRHPDFHDIRPKAPGYACFVDHSYTYYPPSIDLNNLFKYAVPSKEIPSFHLSYEYYLSGYIYRAKVCHKSGIWGEGQHKTDPTLALFWALWQVKEKSSE